MEDNQIVALYLNRDETAIKRTAEKYGSRLRSLSFSITEDRLTAEECENDTYLEAWNTIPSYEPKTYLYAFLARIIRHISIDRCRKRTALKRSCFVIELSEELAESLPASSNVENEMNAKLLGETISKYLLTLSEEKRTMFMRRYFYLDDISAIASYFSISKSKAKTMLFRIRNDLRAYLIREGYNL